MSTPNAKQRAWMQRVEKLLLNPPPGIGLYTIGDCDLRVYDATKEKDIHARMDQGCGTDFCCAVHYLGAELGTIDAAMCIHSTSG